MNLLKISAFAIISAALLMACSEDSPFKAREKDLELERGIYKTKQELENAIDSLEAIADSLKKEAEYIFH